MDNMDLVDRVKLKNFKYFYEVIFEKLGGIFMLIIVEYIYFDGSIECVIYFV